jgi:hypothetical protein
MAAREAACSCGQLRVATEGEPIGVLVCHCLACQRRTGSAFGWQAWFPRERVRISGRSREYARIADDGEPRVFGFCPDCGATLHCRIDSDPERIAVPVGAFADPAFPPPRVSVWESRKHGWVALPDGVEHDAT